MISVVMVDANLYQVVVEGEQESVHTVYMSQEYYRTLCGATITHEFVLVQAFRLLMEQAPNQPIPAEFDLFDMSRNYPDFTAELADRLDR